MGTSGMHISLDFGVSRLFVTAGGHHLLVDESPYLAWAKLELRSSSNRHIAGTGPPLLPDDQDGRNKISRL